MLRKIFLILSFVFLAVAYIFPCFILPVGTYKGKLKQFDTEVECQVKFGFNGKVKTKYGNSDWTTRYYKIKNGEVIFSEDKTFNNEDLSIFLINSFDKVNIIGLGSDLENKLASVITYSVLVLDALLIITIPKKKRRRY